MWLVTVDQVYLCPVLPDCCSVTLRILEIRSVLSKLCFLHPESVQAFHLLGLMFLFIPPLFILVPHDLNLAKCRCSHLLTVFASCIHV